MADSFNKRTGKLSVYLDPTSDVTTNVVNIKIINAIPIMAFDADIITDKSISVLESAAIVDLGTEPCGLVDPVWSAANGNTPRYTFIARPKSPLTNNVVDIYHDAAFGDIIIIPTLKYYNANYSGIVYEIDGHTIGSKKVRTLPRSVEMNFSIESEKDLIKIPDAKPNIVSKVGMILMQGLGANEQLKGWKAVDGTNTYNGLSIAATTYIDLGTKGDLFNLTLPTDPRPIEHYVPVQVTEKQYTYAFANKQDVGDTAKIIIPLIF